MLTALITLILFTTSTSAIDFIFNSFTNSTDIQLVGDATIDSSVIRFTNDSNENSYGRVFYCTKLQIINNKTKTLSSFSTSFIFSILPDIQSSPGFGLAFVLSNTTSPAGAISGQYFGIFSNATHQSPGPLIAVEFDTGINAEFNDKDSNHVGIDLNFIISNEEHTAGYYKKNGSAQTEFVPLYMRSGRNIRAWIEFDGPSFRINVTIAPAEETRPEKPLISHYSPSIANYVSSEMFVGFSASKAKWVEVQRVLAWSLSDTGALAADLNTSNLPNFLLNSSSPPTPRLAAILSSVLAFFILCFLGIYFYRRWKRAKKRRLDEECVDESEFKYWPMRIDYDELYHATNGFSRDQLLGSGGFGKVYKGVLTVSISQRIECRAEGCEQVEVAVKCVSHDSKQGLKEFMAEISTIGRLQHRSLVQIKGWCRKRNELMLVYEYMPNGNLSQWIFSDDKDKHVFLDWRIRRRVLIDVAEGLLYLHHGWEQVVLHRDIKSSNILLDGSMRGKLGDFGLAKLYQRGATPSNTRVVGTLGYLAPELAAAVSPTAASDVYSFGIVVLEVVSGRKPIERATRDDDDDWLLVDWARDRYSEKELITVADDRMDFKVDEMELVLKLGLACCHPEPEQRPTMKEIVELLHAVQ